MGFLHPAINSDSQPVFFQLPGNSLMFVLLFLKPQHNSVLPKKHHGCFSEGLQVCACMVIQYLPTQTVKFGASRWNTIGAHEISCTWLWTPNSKCTKQPHAPYWKIWQFSMRSRQGRDYWATLAVYKVAGYPFFSDQHRQRVMTIQGVCSAAAEGISRWGGGGYQT